MRVLAPALQQVADCEIKAGRRLLTYFGGCDYFRLSRHPQILGAVQRGLRELGLNVSASRLTTGNHPIYQQLEEQLRKFFDVPAAVLVATGYATNLVAAQALAGRFAQALIDERAHASLHDAAALLRCPVRSFGHRDVESLRTQVKAVPRHARSILLTDGMFSHDGSLAPLREYQRAMPAGSWLMVDDAHGVGTLGPNGRGALECEGVRGPRVIQTMTLSKAFGTYGGAILCSADARREIIGKSVMFAGNTPMPLPLARAALESLRWLQRHPQIRRRLAANAAYVRSALRESGWDLPDYAGPVVGFVPRSLVERRKVERALLAARIHPPYIQYPGGPPQGYFRFAISSAHTPEQLRRLVRALGAKR